MRTEDGEQRAAPVNAGQPGGPRLRRVLRITTLTWLPLLALTGVVGGVAMARTLQTDVLGSFLAGIVIFSLAAAVPSLLIVTVYVGAVVTIFEHTKPAFILRLLLAAASTLATLGLLIGLSELTSREPRTLQSMREEYQGWMLLALCLTPILVVIQGRVDDSKK